MIKTGWLKVALLALVSLGATAAEVGLVTAVSGNVKWQEEKAAASELKPFVKVREGDRLMMEGTSRLQVVYFEGGRQETWQGPVALEVGNGSSKTVKGSLQPEVRTLPAILVKQLSKTPSADGNVKTGMIRVRSIPPYDRLETVEKEYAEMRKQADASDRNPELYLLASYLELREFDKIETLLKQLNEKTPGDPDLASLNMLYTLAIREAKR
ncbi:hypothetical protein [Propionivibrio sp.]|uniref:hypothetical protein n=1 Tax=Propionivibrio sp. TaxID=2212460 RepID=UPI003BF17732